MKSEPQIEMVNIADKDKYYIIVKDRVSACPTRSFLAYKSQNCQYSQTYLGMD